MEKITNQTFQVIESINPKLVEVAVTFNYNGQIKRHYIFLNKKKGAGNATYIAEAKKQFELDLKNKKVASLKRRGPVSTKGGSSKLMKGLVIGLSITTLAFAGLFTWKYLTAADEGITLTEAMKWLAEADKNVEKAMNTKIKNEVYTWDLSVTGKGMEPVKDITKGVGGAQYLVANLISEDEIDKYHEDKPTPTPFNELLSKVDGLKKSFTNNWKGQNGGIPAYYTIVHGEETKDDFDVAFFTTTKFESAMFEWGIYYGQKFHIQNDLLYVTFNRFELIKEGEIKLQLEFKQEFAIKKNGFLDHYSIKTDKLPLKIKMGEVDINGTLSGTIDVKFNFLEQK